MIQRLLLALVAGLAVGALVYLMTLSQTFDLSAHNATLESLRQLKQLDSRLNEETLRARLLIDPDSTALIDMLPEVRKAVDSLNQGENAIEKLGDARLKQAYDNYRAAMEKKLQQVEQFETDNLSLAESIETIRLAGEEVLAALPASETAVRQQILQLIKEVLEYGLLPAPENAQKLADLGLEISKLAPTLPIEVQHQAVQLASRPNAVLNQRQANERLLGEILKAPTVKTLAELEASYDAVHNARLREAETYRLILIGYAVVLLLGLAYLGWRLRKSFIDLDKANRQLQRANETLEIKVQERTRDLTKAYAALKSSQAQVVQAEKMASLGQMVAGVAHEINTPLGFVRSNVEMASGMFQDIKRLLDRYAQTIGLIRAPHADETQIAQAFDQLAATEAQVDTGVLDDAGTLLTDSLRGLNQINDLVTNLKDFSRLDRSRMDWFDVNEGLDGTLTICRNQLKDRIEVVKNYGQVPQIQCAPSQINQIFLNLITNATQAISGQGQIRLTTRATGGEVQIVVEDTGCGMTPEVMDKIFEPFFTTKEVGKGTGLGLSIVYQIVQEHRGRIDVQSQPGKGSRFTVTLPVQQQAEAA
ncbi:MAG TPA: DAHL domain-containing protein [Nevskiales bacterium]|nr:DAHL domain-containing protein [Nevskiales bacterium]